LKVEVIYNRERVGATLRRSARRAAHVRSPMIGHVITPIGVMRMNTGAISPAAMSIQVLEELVPSPPSRVA